MTTKRNPKPKGQTALTNRIKKPRLRKGKDLAHKFQPTKVPADKLGEMFVFWCQNGRNLSLTGRQYGMSIDRMAGIRKREKWDHRYEKKILPKLRAIFEAKAIDGMTTGLEIIREIRNKVAQRILDTYKVGSEETMSMPTLQELCRILFTEEYMLRGNPAPPSVTFNEFGPNLTLIQINSDKSPQQIKERYIELADRLREAGDIEERRARLDPDGNSSSQI